MTFFAGPPNRLSAPSPGEWAHAQTRSIGRRSREMKNLYLLRRIWRVLAGVAGVCGAALAFSLATGRSIGSAGLMITALAGVMIAALLLCYPRLRVPPTGTLAQLPLNELAGNTQLWLETRRIALPEKAARVLDHVGIQLDALALQLDRLDREPINAATIRALVGSELPGIINDYLSGRPVLAISPEVHLVEQLSLCSHHIALITRRLSGTGLL